jgi:hypothetical protein
MAELHAKAPGLIIGGGQHAALGRAAHRDRLSAQFGMIALLQRGKEGVPVAMDDLADRAAGKSGGQAGVSSLVMRLCSCR